MGQECVLLTFVEAVNLIDEKDRSTLAKSTAILCVLNGIADVFDARKNR
jgi:hypothetical protein